MIPTTRFERYDYDKRWPGILQSKLGEGFQIIEECLCARTIDSDDLRPGFEGRNGTSYLEACLDSQYPLDIIIISLGLNEIKSIYDWSAKDVAGKMRNMIDLIQNRKPNFHDSRPDIIILSQPIVRHTGFWGDLWISSHEKSIALNREYGTLAKDMGIKYIDLSSITPDTKDGVHIDSEQHKNVADILYQYFVNK